MEQFIQKLAEDYNLTQEEATNIVNDVTTYLNEEATEQSTVKPEAVAATQTPVAQAKEAAQEEGIIMYP